MAEDGYNSPAMSDTERVVLIDPPDPLENPRYAYQLDRRLIDQFCKLIRRGLPADAACNLIGVSYRSFWIWLKKGKEYLESDSPPDHYYIYAQFVRGFEIATAEYRQSLVRQLHIRGNREWLKVLSILERRDRKTFGKNEPVGGEDDELDVDEKFL